MATAKQLLRPSPISNTQFTVPHSYIQLNPKTYPIFLSNHPPKTLFTSQGRHLSPILKAAPQNTTTGEDDGISLGTMKLPPNTDLARFETLLFQWANSLCQGASLPLSGPLKVDRVRGGARLGFVELVGDGEVEVPVYIDCVVFPASGGAAGPMFRAVRNGPKKDLVAPDEPRIMRSLLQALEKCVQIAAA